VQAGIHFAPLPDNKFFGSRPGFDNYRRDRTMATTDRDGRFRLATIPGKALVAAQVSAGETFHGEHLSPYRRAVPDPKYKDLFQYDADQDSWFVNSAGGIEFLMVENAVKVIDIKESGETTVELFVEKGRTASLNVEDSNGKSLSGCWIAGITDHWPITYKVPEATAKIWALNPDKARTLVLFQPQKKLGGTVAIRGDEKEPVVTKLQPVGNVTGRMLEADGTPLKGASISINPRSWVAGELYRIARMKEAVTDKDGKFTLTDVVPGMPFSVGIRKGQAYFVGKPKIGVRQVKAGEKLDIGDCKVDRIR
jgi:hypothetical protein